MPAFCAPPFVVHRRRYQALVTPFSMAPLRLSLRGGGGGGAFARKQASFDIELGNMLEGHNGADHGRGPSFAVFPMGVWDTPNMELA